MYLTASVIGIHRVPKNKAIPFPNMIEYSLSFYRNIVQADFFSLINIGGSTYGQEKRKSQIQSFISLVAALTVCFARQSVIILYSKGRRFHPVLHAIITK